MDSKELRNLHEAYMDVYAPQEVDEAVKGESGKRREDLAAERRSGIKPLSAKEGQKYASHKLSQMSYVKRQRMGEEVEGLDEITKDLAHKVVNARIARTGRAFDREMKDRTPENMRDTVNAVDKETRAKRLAAGVRTRRNATNEEVDIFDTILEHLIAEGYADTNESALVIMANMSEEWRQDIMEISQKTATRAYAQSATGEFEGADDESDIKRTDRLRGHIERKFGKKAGEDADRHADSSTFGRKDPRTGKRQPKPESRFQNPNKYRTTKDGKMHGQDQNKLKAKLERARAQKESFNIFVNSMIAEGVSMEQYTWEEIQNVFDDLFEAQVANRNPDEYERKAKQGQSREQQLKGRVMGRMSQMDPDKKAAMLKQMRAVGLDV